ncbi:MAG TPA: insulinase family protein, partial [Kofleriaceae bacterium]|nr:insulinase family protein [Kofleriaceae bacterium]
MRRHLIVVALAACGPKGPPTVVPILPGDGDTNTAKPTVVKHAADDVWSGKELITPPAPKPPSAVELPAIEDYKLANGLQIYVIKSNKLPTVSMQLAIRAGRMAEPRARLGVSELTADMLVKGTRRRDAAALAKTIDFVGGTIAADATFEATLVSCSVLS